MASKLAGFQYRPMRALGRPASETSDKPTKAEKSVKKTAFEKIKGGLKEALEIAESDVKRGQNTRAARPKSDDCPSDTAEYDIKGALSRTGLSHTRAAELIGVWKSTVDDWCAGAETPQYARTILDLYEHCPPARERLEAQHPREVKPRGKPFVRKKV